MTEQIYNDFVTKVLPKIQEGLTITFEYFQDLFGRFVKYLIVIDLISIIIGIILLIISLYFINKAVKNKDTDQYFGGWSDWRIGMFVISFIVSLIAFAIIVSNSFDLAKGIYVPEIRVYEELKSYNISE